MFKSNLPLTLFFNKTDRYVNGVIDGVILGVFVMWVVYNF